MQNFSDPMMFDEITAKLVLEQLSYDGYKDDGQPPTGYKFKVISWKSCSNLEALEIVQQS